MSGDPKFRAAAACAVSGPVAWTVAFGSAALLLPVDLDSPTTALGEPAVPFLLFAALGLFGGMLGGGRWRALSSIAAGVIIAGLALLLLGRDPSKPMLIIFPLIAGPIMGFGYALGARTGRKISKGAFSGLFAGASTTLLAFLVFGLRPKLMETAIGVYMAGLAISYAASFVFFAFYSTTKKINGNGRASCKSPPPDAPPAPDKD